MLNRDSEKVLKILKKNNFEFNNIDDFCAFLPKMKRTDIEGALCYLDKKEYIECIFCDNTIYSIFPTYEGEHYFQFRWKKLKSFLYRSILTPIIVSVITTLLVKLLSP